MLSFTYLFSGLIDYWGGDGDRWDDNKGCLFASYNPQSTLRDIVDGLVSDFGGGGDCDSMPEHITSDDVRTAILASFTARGRDDYASGAVADIASQLDSNDWSDDDDREWPVVIGLLTWEVSQ